MKCDGCVHFSFSFFLIYLALSLSLSFSLSLSLSLSIYLSVSLCPLSHSHLLSSILFASNLIVAQEEKENKNDAPQVARVSAKQTAKVHFCNFTYALCNNNNIKIEQKETNFMSIVLFSVSSFKLTHVTHSGLVLLNFTGEFASNMVSHAFVLFSFSPLRFSLMREETVR